MSRVIKNKELVNTRLATNYGGWMYCNKCNENKKVDSYEIEFTCKSCNQTYKRKVK